MYFFCLSWWHDLPLITLLPLRHQFWHRHLFEHSSFISFDLAFTRKIPCVWKAPSFPNKFSHSEASHFFPMKPVDVVHHDPITVITKSCETDSILFRNMYCESYIIVFCVLIKIWFWLLGRIQQCSGPTAGSALRDYS